MEFHALTDLESPDGAVFRNFPGLSQLRNKFVRGNSIIVDQSFVDILYNLATRGVVGQRWVECVSITNGSLKNSIRISATSFIHGLIVIAREDWVQDTAFEPSLFITMRSCQNNWNTYSLVVIKLIELLVNLMSFRRIDFAYTLIK